MDKQQTAVEWYIEQHNILAKISDSLSHGEIVKRISDIEKQAKEMEKNQIIDAHRKGQEAEKDYYNVGDKSMTRHTGNSMEYYEKTYGGNK
jgi:hypothetical protein